VRLTCKESRYGRRKAMARCAGITAITNQHGEAVANYDVLTMVSEKAVPDA